MAKERASYRSSLSAESITRWGVILTAVVVLGGVGVRLFLFSHVNRDGAEATGRAVAELAPGAAETWAQAQHHEWPVVVCRAEAQFQVPIYRATGNICLVNLPGGEVAGLTVSTMQAPSGAAAANDEAEIEAFAQAIISWKAGVGAREIVFAGLRLVPVKAWLEGVTLLKVPAEAELPATPLNVRRALYASGTKMFVVASRPDGGQVVYPARVLGNESSGGAELITTTSSRYLRTQSRRGDGSATTLRLDAKVSVAEVLGAPVLDAQGHLAAVVTEPVADANAGQKTASFYAFGMEALRGALEGREQTPVGKKPARLRP